MFIKTTHFSDYQLKYHEREHSFYLSSNMTGGGLCYYQLWHDLWHGTDMFEPRAE